MTIVELQSEFESSLYRAGEYHAAWWHRNNPGSDIGVIFCHAHGAFPYMYYYAPFDSIPRAVADARHPVIVGDLGFGGYASWGKPDSLLAVDAAWAYMQTRCGVRSDKVILIGTSMGSLVANNWARTHIANVAAMALRVPTTHLQVAHDTLPAYSAEIETVYGGLAALVAAYPTHDPIRYAAAFNGQFPIKAWYSTNDPLIPPSTVLAYQAVTGCAVESVGAVGHDTTAVTGAQLVTWLRSVGLPT